MMYKEVKGNLITMALNGDFDVIAHGCNCFCTMGAGIAPQMAKAFGCDDFPLEKITITEYDGEESWEVETGNKGDINKLGQIDYGVRGIKNGKVYAGWSIPYPKMKEIAIVNAYTQYGFGRNHENGSVAPIDYEALTLCMRKINHIFAGKVIGLPTIGAGLAGGDWNRIKKIIYDELKDCEVVVVIYDNPTPEIDQFYNKAKTSR